MKPVWLTVDSDDLRHVPSSQGHPTRSSGKFEEGTSQLMLQAMNSFRSWLDRTQVTLTIFVIADQLEDEVFSEWLRNLLKEHPQVTIGCHGLTHRCWSAWPKDEDGLLNSLVEADIKLHHFAKEQWRPWFRAPAGYIAPWMAPVIAKAGFELDSSVNHSWLTRKKAGPWRDWKAVEKALKDSGLISRPWLTRFGLPTCGPALSIFPLSILANQTWKKLGPFVQQEDAECTIYWHILDHAKKNCNWTPPLMIGS
ncbi:MAG: polysaccharide deacetylase family protein [Candidatus Poseidoniaceae archaeon]|jgi:peptidoglycan/xylan/chitin deacetylase (PgdA/CDA1 family)|nr:polysaccharide deacetylase family protein [Candidatus Poseidoniaceae archaeon]